MFLSAGQHVMVQIVPGHSWAEALAASKAYLVQNGRPVHQRSQLASNKELQGRQLESAQYLMNTSCLSGGNLWGPRIFVLSFGLARETNVAKVTT